VFFSIKAGSFVLNEFVAVVLSVALDLTIDASLIVTSGMVTQVLVAVAGTLLF
jgi:hypothetical protein